MMLKCIRVKVPINEEKHGKYLLVEAEMFIEIESSSKSEL